MSVHTTADEKLNSASNRVKEAIKDLSAIVVDECWGHDEYTKEYTDGIHQIMAELIDIKRRLNRE